MAVRTLPGLGLTGFWTLGSSGWKDANDVNLRTLSALCQARVKSRTTALPGTPTLGDIYIVVSSDPTNPNKIAIWDGEASSETWNYIDPQEGFFVYVEDDNEYVQYDGSAWQVFSGGGGGSVPVQDDGVEQVATPTALNFTGAGVTVTDVSGVATIDIPGGGAGSDSGDVSFVRTSVSVTNGDFETGDGTGWTVDTGTISVVAFAASSWDDPSIATASDNGTYILTGGSQALLTLHQDIDISGDNGVFFYEGFIDFMKDFNDSDVARMTLQLLDGSSNVLSQNSIGDGVLTAGKRAGFVQVPVVGQPTTLRIILDLDRGAGTANNCAVDNISVNRVKMNASAASSQAVMSELGSGTASTTYITYEADLNYDRIEVDLKGISVDANAQPLQLQVKVNGSWVTAGYDSAGVGRVSTAFVGNCDLANGAAFQLTSEDSNWDLDDTGEVLNGKIWITGLKDGEKPAFSSVVNYVLDYAANAVASFTAGGRQRTANTGAVEGIRLLVGSGALTGSMIVSAPRNVGGGSSGEAAKTIPLKADFSIDLNSGLAGSTDGTYCLYMEGAADASLLRGLLNSAGGADFTVTVKVATGFIPNYSGAGILIRDSAGKYVGFGPLGVNGATNIEFAQWSDQTTFSSGASNRGISGGKIWLRIFYDHSAGTIEGFCSFDGENFHSMGTNSYLGANVDAVGIGIMNRNSGNSQAGWFYHYEVT